MRSSNYWKQDPGGEDRQASIRLERRYSSTFCHGNECWFVCALLMALHTFKRGQYLAGPL